VGDVGIVGLGDVERLVCAKLAKQEVALPFSEPLEVRVMYMAASDGDAPELWLVFLMTNLRRLDKVKVSAFWDRSTV
jgi:hypothetical protein